MKEKKKIKILLSTELLKKFTNKIGYVPQKTSREVFDFYVAHNSHVRNGR